MFQPFFRLEYRSEPRAGGHGQRGVGLMRSLFSEPGETIMFQEGETIQNLFQSVSAPEA